jgi:5-methyltetrahydropteroyltriglutamate--homocysteine methyltransferase
MASIDQSIRTQPSAAAHASSVLQVTVAGRFPIVRAGQHPLRAALEAWRVRGDATPESALNDEAVLAAQAIATQELIEAQEAAGIDLPGDGYVPVYDEWYAWAPAVAGVRLENAVRYLDTNTYYHRWRLVERPRRLRPSPHLAAYKRAAALTARPVKPCLFGPYTVWAYAWREGEGDTPAAFDALAGIWAAEVADLASAGARWVQLDESVLLRPKHRADMPLVARAVQRIARAVPQVNLIVHFACGFVGDLLDPLLALPVRGIGLDLTDVYREPNLAALARWHGDKLLQAGVTNAREIRIETPSDLRQTLAAVTAYVQPTHVLASPSTALLYLPRHAAFDKLAALVQAAHGSGEV